MGRRPVVEAPPPRRQCNYPGCTTRLNQYNKHDRCLRHQGMVVESGRGKKPTLPPISTAGPLSAKMVMDIVARTCAVDHTAILNPKRDLPEAVEARHVLMYLLKNDLKWTLEKIGQWVGGRKMETAKSGATKIRHLLENSQRMQDLITSIRAQYPEKN